MEKEGKIAFSKKKKKERPNALSGEMAKWPIIFYYKEPNGHKRPNGQKAINMAMKGHLYNG